MQQTRDDVLYEIPDGTYIDFTFIFNSTIADDAVMPYYMKEVKVWNESNVFITNGTIRLIDKSLLNENSGFDFGSYNNDDAVVKGSAFQHIVKPTILDKFPVDIRRKIVIRTVIGQPQDTQAITLREA